MLPADGYQSCPECGAELWYPEPVTRDELGLTPLQTRGQQREYISRSPVGTIAPGGSKSGRRKKPASKKDSLQKLNDKLYN